MYDRIIIGAGLYGLYAALFCAKKGERVLVLECEDAPFKRATYINQARVHMGYHYPRSFSTAIKSAGYFERFVNDYSFCILDGFDQIYATSSTFSWTDAREFKRFCNAAGIMCEEVNARKYFKPDMCDGAFLTREYTYDAFMLRDYFSRELDNYKNVDIKYNAFIESITPSGSEYDIMLRSKEHFSAPFVLNATYASVNQIGAMLSTEPLKIKYELCEIIICRVGDKLNDVGITVMDGPFFSIMPFGKTGKHSLTSVTFTPHITSYDTLPRFECQSRNANCTCSHLADCNVCSQRPDSAWNYMSAMARKYMRDEYSFEYESSLFSVKPILKASEIDDSRPTVIREFDKAPNFITVLSGKINTVYDLDEVLS